MSDRSADTTRTTSARRAASGGSGSTGSPASSGSDDTAIRPSLADRIQAKLSSSDAAETTAPAKARTGSTPRAEREPRPKAKPATAGRAPRRARLRLTRVDPWSVMKTAFLLSIAFGIVTVVAVGMIWTVLDQAGVWTSVNETVQGSIGGPETANFDIENYVGTSRVLGFTMLIAAVDVVLLTAIATLGAFLYNMSAALLGGVEVTLAEDQN